MIPTISSKSSPLFCIYFVLIFILKMTDPGCPALAVNCKQKEKKKQVADSPGED
jgi:hypothetical protein